MLSKFIVDLQTRIVARKAEEGQGLVEYALIIALVAILCVGALGAIQGGIDGSLRDIATSLTPGA